MVPIDIQIFAGRIVAPPVTDAKKDDILLFKVRILDDKVRSVEIEFKNLELLDQAGGGRGRGRNKGRNGNSRKIDFMGKAVHKKPDDVVWDKYTITTFDGSNPKKEIAKLDPFIIICG